MKLLMITRKVDKDNGLAGFVYNWINKIGKEVDELYVICLEAGNTEGLGNNIKILPVRKGETKNILARKIKDLSVFQKMLLKNIKNADGVFCHMNPEYTIAAWPIAKLFNKKIVSWYAHGAISRRLKVLEKMADKILTSSKKGFRLKSKKLIITGNGIDTEKFKPGEEKDKDKFTIISVGRISPTKDLETLIKAIDIIINKEKERDIRLKIVGTPGLKAHRNYYESLQTMVKNMNLSDHVSFVGEISNKDIPEHLSRADLFVNLSNTGSLDKAILEAMACELLVLTSNEAFGEILKNDFLVKQNDFKALANKILQVKHGEMGDKKAVGKELRNIVVKKHNLNNLIKTIVEQFK